MNLQPRVESNFLNRELSLLAFNRRVLAQAADQRIPLLERLRFLCIFSSNLDEFFEIRVASVRTKIKLDSQAVEADGMLPQEVFRRITQQTHTLVSEQYALLNDDILPSLAKESIAFVRRAQWTDEQRQWIQNYFRSEVMPLLTPIGLDPSHPFPKVLNKSLNFAVELVGTDAFGRNSGTAIVQAPRALPRIIRLPPELSGAKDSFVFLSSVMHQHVGALFPVWKYSAAINSASPATLTCLLTKKKLKTCAWPCKVNCHSGILVMRCAWKLRIIALAA
jgi:Polyphosphate kinase